MSKEQLIEIGLEIEKISKLSEIRIKYEDWKIEILRYAKENDLILE